MYPGAVGCLARWLTLLVAVTGVARGDDLAAVEQRGRDAAKNGKFSEAIDAFKQADRLAARASHACLIALAYTRRELWPQAEIFFTLCHQRASASDPLPDWLALAEKTLAEHLASANVAEVEIHVEPASANVMLAVSSFASDEQFSPRRIHLAFGEHVITARAPGYETAQQSISIADKTTKQIVIALRPHTLTVRSPMPWYVAGAGAAVLALGAAYDVLAVRPLRDRLSDDVHNLDVTDYRANSHSFDVRRDIAIGLYAAGAATVIAGAVLYATGFHSREVMVGVDPVAGGGVATMTWRTR
jgi:hypothetical protein